MKSSAGRVMLMVVMALAVQVMSLGLSVEFCLHVAMAFQRAHGTR